MLRFIIKREIKDGYNGLVLSDFETLDLDVPSLESILTGGGFSENSYDRSSLVGVEVLALTQRPTNGGKHGQQ